MYKITNDASSTPPSGFEPPSNCNALVNGLIGMEKPKTFDEVREIFELVNVPDGHIHQIALDAGFSVVPA